MQKLRPDLNIGGNIQKIRYDRKLTQDQVIAKMNLMGIQISMRVVYKQRQREFFIVAKIKYKKLPLPFGFSM